MEEQIKEPIDEAAVDQKSGDDEQVNEGMLHLLSESRHR